MGYSLYSLLALAACGGTPQAASMHAVETPAVPRESTRLPGSRTSFVLPADMIRVPRMPGYGRADGLVVVISDTTAWDDAATDDILGGMLDGMREAGNVVESPTTTPGGRVVDAHGTDANGAVRLMRTIVMGRAIATMYVTVPTRSHDAEARALLDSMRVDPGIAIDPLLMLDLHLDIPAEVELMPTGSQFAAFWERGSAPPLPATAPTALLIYAPYPPDPDARAAAIEVNVGTVIARNGLDEATLARGPVSIGGWAGFEMSGPGTIDGEATAFYGVVLDLGDGIVIMYVRGGAGEPARIEPFRAMFGTLRGR
jgi:hypothetical protein